MPLASYTLHLTVCTWMKMSLSSDGNAKDSIRITSNLKFQFNDTQSVSDLQEYKENLVKDLLKSAFWQNQKPSEYNLLKVPIIMAPALLRQQVNNDILKESLLDKSVVHSAETMREFVRLVDNKEIRIMEIGMLYMRFFPIKLFLIWYL